MASIRYCAPVGTEVSSAAPGTGAEVRIAFGKDGTYTTSDPAEIAVLDGLAELQVHPIGFAPKDKE